MSECHRTSEPLYECNACDWIGPGRETVHPKHDETCWVCPECHETIAPVVGRPSKPTDTWKDRALEMCALLDKWSIYMQLAGTKPVSGDVRDNPVLALLADTRACLRKPVPADETPDCPKCIAVRKLGLRACQAHLPAVETSGEAYARDPNIHVWPTVTAETTPAHCPYCGEPHVPVMPCPYRAAQNGSDK